MKKCPVCNQRFTMAMLMRRRFSQSATKLMGEYFADGKGVIRCPHCESRLRKKISISFLLALIPFLISVGIYIFTRQYDYLMYISIMLFLVVYINLPYVPYDN